MEGAGKGSFPYHLEELHAPGSVGTKRDPEP